MGNSPAIHRIFSLKFDLDMEVNSDYEGIQNRISQLTQKEIPNLIEDSLDTFPSPGETKVIPQLTLDLGDINLLNLEDDLLAKLRPVLESALLAEVGSLPSSENSSLDEEVQVHGSANEAFLFFLDHGSLPWWWASSKPRPQELLEELLKDDFPGKAEFLRRSFGLARRQKRLVHSFPENLYRNVLEAISLPVHAPQVLQKYEHWSKVELRKPFWERIGPRVTHVLKALVLSFVVRGISGTFQEEHLDEFIREQLSREFVVSDPEGKGKMEVFGEKGQIEEKGEQADRIDELANEVDFEEGVLVAKTVEEGSKLILREELPALDESEETVKSDLRNEVERGPIELKNEKDYSANDPAKEGEVKAEMGAWERESPTQTEAAEVSEESIIEQELSITLDEEVEQVLVVEDKDRPSSKSIAEITQPKPPTDTGEMSHSLDGQDFAIGDSSPISSSETIPDDHRPAGFENERPVRKENLIPGGEEVIGPTTGIAKPEVSSREGEIPSLEVEMEESDPLDIHSPGENFVSQTGDLSQFPTWPLPQKLAWIRNILSRNSPPNSSDLEILQEGISYLIRNAPDGLIQILFSAVSPDPVLKRWPDWLPRSILIQLAQTFGPAWLVMQVQEERILSETLSKKLPYPLSSRRIQEVLRREWALVLVGQYPEIPTPASFSRQVFLELRSIYRNEGTTDAFMHEKHPENDDFSDPREASPSTNELYIREESVEEATRKGKDQSEEGRIGENPIEEGQPEEVRFEEVQANEVKTEAVESKEHPVSKEFPEEFSASEDRIEVQELSSRPSKPGNFPQDFSWAQNILAKDQIPVQEDLERLHHFLEAFSRQASAQSNESFFAQVQTNSLPAWLPTEIAHQIQALKTSFEASQKTEVPEPLSVEKPLLEDEDLEAETLVYDHLIPQKDASSPPPDASYLELPLEDQIETALRQADSLVELRKLLKDIEPEFALDLLVPDHKAEVARSLEALQELVPLLHQAVGNGTHSPNSAPLLLLRTLSLHGNQAVPTALVIRDALAYWAWQYGLSFRDLAQRIHRQVHLIHPAWNFLNDLETILPEVTGLSVPPADPAETTTLEDGPSLQGDRAETSPIQLRMLEGLLLRREIPPGTSLANFREQILPWIKEKPASLQSALGKWLVIPEAREALLQFFPKEYLPDFLAARHPIPVKIFTSLHQELRTLQLQLPGPIRNHRFSTHFWRHLLRVSASAPAAQSLPLFKIAAKDLVQELTHQIPSESLQSFFQTLEEFDRKHGLPILALVFEEAHNTLRGANSPTGLLPSRAEQNELPGEQKEVQAIQNRLSGEQKVILEEQKQVPSEQKEVPAKQIEHPKKQKNSIEAETKKAVQEQENSIKKDLLFAVRTFARHHLANASHSQQWIKEALSGGELKSTSAIHRLVQRILEQLSEREGLSLPKLLMDFEVGLQKMSSAFTAHSSHELFVSILRKLQREHPFVAPPPPPPSDVIWEHKPDRPKYPWFGEGDDATEIILSVHNAGIVLFWPWLSNLFDYTGLMEDSEWIDPEKQQRAILLLHFLATHQSTAEESVLTLAKVICGWPHEEPMELSFEPTDQEKEMCESLVQMVIDRWDTLGGPELRSFLAGFVHREGVLSLTEKGWELEVERQPFDLLMQTLPWGLAVVNLSWMEHPIYVQWE